MREAARNQPIEKVGRELREMMTFLKKKKESGVPEEQSGAGSQPAAASQAAPITL
jgi:hypothetical protein